MRFTINYPLTSCDPDPGILPLASSDDDNVDLHCTGSTGFSAPALFRFMSKQAGSRAGYLELFLLLIQFSTVQGCVLDPTLLTIQENKDF